MNGPLRHRGNNRQTATASIHPMNLYAQLPLIASNLQTPPATAGVVFDGCITGCTGPHQTSTLREESARDSILGNDVVKNLKVTQWRVRKLGSIS